MIGRHSTQDPPEKRNRRECFSLEHSKGLGTTKYINEPTRRVSQTSIPSSEALHRLTQQLLPSAKETDRDVLDEQR